MCNCWKQVSCSWSRVILRSDHFHVDYLFTVVQHYLVPNDIRPPCPPCSSPLLSDHPHERCSTWRSEARHPGTTWTPTKNVLWCSPFSIRRWSLLRPVPCLSTTTTVRMTTTTTVRMMTSRAMTSRMMMRMRMMTMTGWAWAIVRCGVYSTARAGQGFTFGQI